MTPHEAAKNVFKGDIVPRSLTFSQFREEMTTAYPDEPLTDEYLHDLYQEHNPYQFEPKHDTAAHAVDGGFGTYSAGCARCRRDGRFISPVSAISMNVSDETVTPEDLFGPLDLNKLEIAPEEMERIQRELDAEPELIPSLTELIEQVAGVDKKVDKVQQLQERILRMELARQAAQRKNKRQKLARKLRNKFKRRR